MYENSYLSTKMVFRLAIHIFEVSDIPTFRSPYLHFKMDAKRQEISTFHAVIPQDVSIPSDSLYFLRQQNKNLHSFSMKFLLFFFFSYAHQVSKYIVYSTIRNYGLVASFVSTGYPTEQCHVVRMIRSNKTDKLKSVGTIPIKYEVNWRDIVIEWIQDEERPSTVNAMPEPTNEPSNRVSLLELNDDCLLELFIWFDWLELYEMSNVCKRVRAVVLRAAKFKQTINFAYDAWTMLWKVDEYLRTFGTSILRINMHTIDHRSDMLAILISQYCANISELSINLNDQATKLELSPLFKRLHKLKLITPSSTAGVLHTDSQLRSLDIAIAYDSLPPIHLTHLTELCVRRIIWSDGSQTQLRQFFQLNKQIESLEFHRVPPNGMRDILPSLRNPRVLHIEMTFERHEYTDAVDYSILSEFRHLHSLRLNWFNAEVVDDVMQAIGRGGMQLKRLTLLNSSESYPIYLISRNNSIEQLHIDRIDDDDIRYIVTRCTALVELSVNSTKMTVYGVRDVLQQASKLTKASFQIALKFDKKMMADLSVFTDIFELRKKLGGNLNVYFAIALFQNGSVEVSLNFN